MTLLRLAVAAAMMGGVVLAAAGRPHAETVAAVTSNGPALTAPKHEVAVLDGESLRIGGAEVRLTGLVAPAFRQQCVRDRRVEPCGESAAQAVQKIIDLAVKPVECRPEADGRALCFVDGRDVGEALVLQGRAVAADDRYVEAEAQARKAKLGLWATAWVPPDQWRRGARMPEELAARSRVPAADRKPDIASQAAGPKPQSR